MIPKHEMPKHEMPTTVTKAELRRSAYYDSIVLMQLRASLAALPNVVDAGVMMGTPADLELLAQSDLLSPEVDAPEVRDIRPDDLIITVKALDEASASAALAQVDALLTRRRSALQQDYRPQSLETAATQLPDASWVLVSVAGRYAAGVARAALDLGKHVFLFSDNVSIEDEISLKELASARGLLVMGPDCGTAIINGIGLGFANGVRRGPIGVVAAAGTGLQHVTARIHQLGGGLTHGIGTGGHDLTEQVGAVTFRQAIDVLARDPETRVITLVSKPPTPRVAEEMLALARLAPKPVVVNFIGRAASARQIDNLTFATGLDDAARLAVDLANLTPLPPSPVDRRGGVEGGKFAPGQRYLRGLFSGGTLAYEAQYLLQDYLPRVWANAPLDKGNRIPNVLTSREHTIIDLGEDEFTVGRLHPMMDNELRIRRLDQEAADPETAVIMLDVVLGYGSHPDPASELAPAIAKARAAAQADGRYLEIVVVVTGTDEDPQGLASQIEQLRNAGAWVDTKNEATIRYAGQLVRGLNPESQSAFSRSVVLVDLATLQKPLSAINVGLESFAENLIAQGAQAIQVDWRPPAGGNQKLAAILARMKGASRLSS